MTILTKTFNLLYQKQKLIEVITIFLFFTLVAFRFDNKEVKLFWSDYPSLTITLALIIA